MQFGYGQDMQDEDEDPRMRSPLSYTQAIGAANATAARPGYNPQTDPNSSEYVKHERTPDDGMGPRPIEAPMPPASPMMAARPPQAAEAAAQYGQAAMQQRAAQPVLPAQAQQGAAPAGAAVMAKGGGMPPWLGVMAAALARRQQEQQLRRDARAELAQKYAGSLGAQPYGMAAAKFNRDMQRADQTDYLKNLLPFLR